MNNDPFEGLEVEFGSSHPMNFATAENSQLNQSEGVPMLCECGLPAVVTLVGQTSLKSLCQKCLSKELGHFCG